MRIEIIRSLKNIDEHKETIANYVGANESRLHDFEKTEKEWIFPDVFLLIQVLDSPKLQNFKF